MVKSRKDLVTLLEFSSEEIEEILSLAGSLKRTRLKQDPPAMRSRTGVLFFEKPSLRTRVTFETAINELGGHSINLEPDTVQIGRRETVEDVARNLERWVHLVVARTFKHATIVKLARSCSIPVINALTDTFHPCQALAFALTLRERRDAAGDCSVVFVGDGNNVCNSLMVLCAKLGFNFTAVSPAGYEPGKALVEECQGIAADKKARIGISRDLLQSVSRASVIYTDVWTSMGQESETERRKRDFSSFQVNEALVARAPSDVLISHCLPAHRGEEISDEVLDSERSLAFDEAENRLHVQKAVIVHLLSKHSPD